MMYKSDEYMSLFKYVGKNVQVFQNALILKPEMIELDDDVRIDDYSKIEGGNGIKIGKCVHIASFVGILGGGSAVIGDYCAIAQGGRLITGTERTDAVMSAAAPLELRNTNRGHIIMERNSFVSTNAVVMPGITLGEGSIVGAGAVATKDVPPWVIVAGVPARQIGSRQVLDFKKLKENYELKNP